MIVIFSSSSFTFPNPLSLLIVYPSNFHVCEILHLNKFACMYRGGISYRGNLTAATSLKDVVCSSHKPFAVNSSSGKGWVAHPLPHTWWIIDRHSFAQVITDDVNSRVWQPCHAQEILCFTALSLILQHLHSSHVLSCKFHEAPQLRVEVG